MIPSELQLAIYEEGKHGNSDIVVMATAGSGKSTTIVEFSKQINTRALLLAFNKHIVQSITPRVPRNINVKTIHAVGYGCVRDFIRGLNSPNDRKYLDISRSFANEIVQNANDYNLSPFKIAKQINDVSRFCRLTLTNPKDHNAIRAMIGKFSLEVADQELILPVIEKVIAEGDYLAKAKGTIDFTDMLWLPHSFNLEPPAYPFVMVDEAQDLNEAQLELVMKSSRGRRLFVGDKYQCQPPGTLVTLSDLTQIPIEQLKVGDSVVSYDRKGAAFVKKCRVNEIASRPYTGNLYSISVGDKCSKSTDSHRWVVRWNHPDSKAWVTYLMRKGTKFRVGITNLFDNKNKFGLSSRFTIEGGDAAWVLSVHKTLQDALAHEQIISAKFGLPEVTFRQASGNAGQQKMFTQEVIDKIFDELHSQIDSAIRCLEAHGRKIRPLAKV